MKGKTKSYVATLAGVILLAAGLYMIRTLGEPQGIMRALPYVLIGIGCGVFGQGAGDLLSRRALKNSPEAAKQLEIEKKDERNESIANRAKAKAYDMMVTVFGALLLSFALMGVDLVVVLLMVAAYLFVAGCGVYYRIKYDKEM
jgi:hypothetical protein